MNLTQDEIMALTSTESMIEWNKICDKIKSKRNGQYPPDWYQTIIAGGVMAKRAKAWGDPDIGNITIVTS